MKVGAQKCTHISSFKESGGLVSFGTILKYCLTSKALAKLKAWFFLKKNYHSSHCTSFFFFFLT